MSSLCVCVCVCVSVCPSVCPSVCLSVFTPPDISQDDYSDNGNMTLYVRVVCLVGCAGYCADVTLAARDALGLPHPAPPIHPRGQSAHPRQRHACVPQVCVHVRRCGGQRCRFGCDHLVREFSSREMSVPDLITRLRISPDSRHEVLALYNEDRVRVHCTQLHLL